jgi:hypothetical protein
MNRHFLFSVIALFSIIMVANAQAVGVSGQPLTAIYFETFEDLTAFVDFGGQLSDHWTVYQGSPQIVPAGDREAVLKMAHPLPGGTLGAFKDPTSTGLYLSNPVTANFVDGMIEFDIRFETGKQSGVSAMLIFRMQGEDTYYALRLTSTQDWTCYFAKYIGCGNWRMIGTQSELGVFPTDSWSHVAVTVGGPRFQAYKDGVLICVAEDGAWMKGTWGGIGFQNNYYNGVFYIDNVRIPGGFQWNTYRGLPSRDPVMGRSAASMLFDHPSESGDAGPFAEINSYSAYVVKPDTRCFTDGVIEFDIFFDTIGGQKAYMTFRMQSDTEYYALRLTSTPDWESYFIKQNGWGNTEIIGTRSLGGAIPLQAWTHIKVVIRGGLFECYKDGQLICTAYDQMWSVGAWGGVGFFSAYNKGLFHIDNIKIHIIK